MFWAELGAAEVDLFFSKKNEKCIAVFEINHKSHSINFRYGACKLKSLLPLFPNILRPVLTCKPRPSGLSIFVKKVFALLANHSHLYDVWFVNKVCDCEFVNKVFTRLWIKYSHSYQTIHICVKLNWTTHSNKTFSYCYEHWEGDGLAGPLGRNFYTLSCFALQVEETFGAKK